MAGGQGEGGHDRHHGVDPVAAEAVERGAQGSGGVESIPKKGNSGSPGKRLPRKSATMTRNRGWGGGGDLHGNMESS